MKRGPKRWRALLTVAITINVIGVVGLHYLNAELRAARARLAPDPNKGFPRFEGVDMEGNWWVPSGGSCLVVRMTDDACAYCKKDAPAYESVLSAASSASCEVVEIAPNAGAVGYSPHAGIVQLKYVDSDLSQVMFPFVTPQTVILDRNWSIRLVRRGTFDRKSLATAVDVIKSLSDSAAAPADRPEAVLW